jgi:hypothetical protein
MLPAQTRRSDRITIELPLQVSGDDIKGFAFVEKTRTAVITRHGAKIYSRYKMARDQELVVGCLTTGKESEARIVGELGAGPEGYSYGIEFLNLEVNLWDVEFPPSQAEQAAGRTLLECIRCGTRELVYLDAMEVEVLDTGQGLSRSCNQCTDMLVWKVVRESAASEPAAQPAPPVASTDQAPAEPARTQNERKDARIGAKLSTLIRHPYLGDEVVSTENVASGGLSVRSIRRYRTGTLIEVAFPYTPGGANIFVAARIEHENEVPGEKFRLYGLEYLPAHEDWPRK